MRFDINRQSMKNILIFAFLIFGLNIFAQNALLTKVAKVHQNSDKIFYRIDTAQAGAEYLGEVEVQGFSNDDPLVFSKVYQKGKEIGANAFAYVPFESIDGSVPAFDPWNYRLKLFYLPAQDFPAENNTVYLFSSPVQKQKITFSKENLEFEPRTYTVRKLSAGEIYTLSTKKFLGSSVKLSAKEGQPVQHFQLSAFKVKSNPYGSAGINLKSGDIVLLERSFADFLSVIYKKF